MIEELTLAQKIAIWALPILFAITLHEAAHGWVAFKRGDPTAYLAGRITMNPLKHIDWLGTVLIPVLLVATLGFAFGWAKPVPVNVGQLKKPRWDSALVAAAGPLSNFLMALFWGGLSKLGLVLVTAFPEFKEQALWLFLMGQAGIAVNLILLLINLLPIPPLDGSRVVASFLPIRARLLYQKIEPFGFFILLAMVAFQWLNPIIEPLFKIMQGGLLNLFNIA
ncbi:MAG: site-2 protease family protein [Gammaproteobacteria bacterium]